MGVLRSALASAVAVCLAACQTVNGVAISPRPAQGGGDTFCERNIILCIGGGALLIGGIAYAASSHSYGMHNYSGSGMGSGTGSGTGY